MPGWEKLIIIIVFLLFCSFTISSCLNEERRQNVYYIISQNQPSVSISDPSEPPLPPIVFYGKLNFIIIDSGEILFFTKHVEYKNCKDRDGVRPPYLGLLPNDITVIEIDTLENFLVNAYSGLNQVDSTQTSQEKFFSNYNNYYTTVSSPKDTIRTKAVKIILDFMDKKKFKKYIIRRSTEEEENVVQTKQNGQVFDPKKIKWKVGFDPGCE